MQPERAKRPRAPHRLRALAAVLGLVLGATAQAGLVCNTVDVGNRDFNGVSGSSDSHVIAVGRNGTIYRYDGANWAAMASGTNAHLEDVEVVSDTLAWASGRRGTVLRYDGTSWTDVSPATNEEMFGVWADSTGEVWAGGDKGEIHYYDGVAWTEVTGAAGTNDRDIEDLWGDASSVYAMNDRGVLYRFDRVSGSWDAPDATCSPGDNYTDLWGDGAGNLYLSDRDGVYRYDGAACSLQTASGNHLYGIHGDTGASVIYASGIDGVVMDFDGLAWRETSEGIEDLNDVWVSATGGAYYGGDNGEVTACTYVPPNLVADWLLDDCTSDFPGSLVVDNGPNALDGITVGATAVVDDGALCVAAGLDGATGHVAVPDSAPLDLSDGLSFAVWIRHDGSALGDWDAIFAKGDSSYRLHLNGGCGMADALPGNTRHGITFGLNGGCGNADLNSNVVPAPGVWYHVAGTYDRTRLRIFINGVLVNWADHTPAIGTNNSDLFIGENSQSRGRYWPGDIDELTLWDDELRPADVTAHMNRTRPCASCSEPVLNVSHDGYGIHCLGETVTVNVTDSLAGTPYVDYNEQVTLDTQTGTGTWTLVAGGGAFVDAVAADGLATYDWPLGESSAQFALGYTDGPAGVDIDVFQTSDTSLRDDDTEGPIVFGASGFTVTDAALSNPPPGVIAPFAAPQVAGSDFAVHLAAYGQLPGDSACGIIESYAGAKAPAFWFGYDDPGAGTRAPTVDGVGIGTVEGAAVPQPVAFTNGQAVVTVKYKDAGRIQLSVKDATPDPALPTGIRGATAPFVVRPLRFALSNIVDGGGAPNPAAADAAGPVFVAAGAQFGVTVTALDAEGDATPNYGRESIAESVALTPTLVAPGGGDNPPVASVTGFGAFAGGSASGNDFSWPEVGIITLTPSVADGSYLGAGDVTGSVSGNVGRFVPAYFDTALNAPSFNTQCAAGSFTYLGQPFGYSVPPVIAVTARAAGGTATRNYTGAFFKMTNASLANRSYAAATGSLNTAGLPGAATDPAVADTGGGNATLTFASGAGLLFDRGALQDAFDASVSLGIDVLDTDAVSASNPVSFAAPMAFSSGRNMRYGRLYMGNAAGSELVDLALPMQAQWYVDAATGFVPNLDDACTTPAPLALAAFTANLAAGETCALDIGSPGASGAGCAAPAAPGERFRSPPLGGDFNLRLRAPGAGNNGSVTVTADAPDWLEFDWDVASPGLEDPAGVAAFGVFPGNARKIYQREIY